MGVAAYNRGSEAISEHISMASRPAEFQMMDYLNGLPKYPDAGRPFGPVSFVPFRGKWSVECPVTGYGFFYRTLHEAVKRWRVPIVGYDASTGIWEGVP